MRLIYLVFTVVVFLTNIPQSTIAQKVNKRPQTPVVTLSQIYRDIVGQTVSDVPIEGRNGQVTSWIFDAAETREIKIISRSQTKNELKVRVEIITQDVGNMNNGPSSIFRGSIVLMYERVAKGWLLSDVQRGDATLRVIEKANISSLNQNSVTRSYVVVRNPFVVAPGKLHYFAIQLEYPGIVSGTFRARGGGGNDIEVLILDSNGFENYRNGHRVQPFYNSERVTVGTLNVSLARGSYFLVFNNGFSLFSNKAIEADISVQH